MSDEDFSMDATNQWLAEIEREMALQRQMLRDEPVPQAWESPLRTKSFAWAVATAKALRGCYGRDFDRHFARQVVRSATAVAASIEEGNAAVSKKDFLYKFKHALKEANESKLWLKMIYELAILPPDQIRPILELGNEVRYMLAASVKTFEANNPTSKPKK